MLHTKSIATQDTAGWQTRCKGLAKRGWCRIGVPFPPAKESAVIENNATKDEEGWLYNCYVNPKIENYWVPLLDKDLENSRVSEIARR